MNDGITFGAIISGFLVTWGWLIKISFMLGEMKEKLKNLEYYNKYGGEIW